MAAVLSASFSGWSPLKCPGSSISIISPRVGNNTSGKYLKPYKNPGNCTLYGTPIAAIASSSANSAGVHEDNFAQRIAIRLTEHRLRGTTPTCAKVLYCVINQNRIVTEAPQARVAASAQPATSLARRVVVVPVVPLNTATKFSAAQFTPSRCAQDFCP